jgi:hypothetical protein
MLSKEKPMSEKYLTRAEAAAYLTERGLPISKNTLQKMACLGGGPPYRIFGNKALHRPSELVEWASTKLAAPKRSTSEVERDDPRNDRAR